MDRNKMKRKIAMMLCVCVLFASSAPLALAEAEATPSEPQVATLEENQPKQPVSREKIGMKLTPNNGVVSVALTGTAEKELCDAAESYLLTQLERSFYTLDFYKSLLTE